MCEYVLYKMMSPARIHYVLESPIYLSLRNGSPRDKKSVYRLLNEVRTHAERIKSFHVRVCSHIFPAQGEDTRARIVFPKNI